MISKLENTSILEDYKNGISISELVEKYNTKYHTIYHFLKTKGEKINRTYLKQSKYNFNEFYLDNLDCQEKFYFLGFFFADGCNRKKGYEISIGLNQKDTEILEKFKKLFESDRPLVFEERMNNNYHKIQKKCTFVLGNKHLSNRLYELGAVYNKTLVLQFPNYIPKQYLSHFIRGYFDGDGSLSIRNNGKNGMTGSLHICSSNTFVEQLVEIVYKEIGVKGRIDYSSNGNYAVYNININRDIKKFLEWMYQDATIYLQRKFDKKEEYLNNRNFDVETQFEKRKRLLNNVDKIIYMYTIEGKSATQISKEFKIKTNAILSILRENNIQIRKNQRQKQINIHNQ